MQILNEMASNQLLMRWAGAVVLALLGFVFMRVRRHSFANCLAFGSGILGIFVVLSLIKYVLL